MYYIHFNLGVPGYSKVLSFNIYVATLNFTLRTHVL